MERPDLYQDDLTEEREPSPAERDSVAGSLRLDPDIAADPEHGGGDGPAANED